MRIARLLRTVKYLKPVQIFYQVYYRIFPGKVSLPSREVYGKPLILYDVRPVSETADNKSFTFLNQIKAFPDKIDWNFMGYGKLWNYNLQYCDFLLQNTLHADVRASWLEDLYISVGSGKVKPEPYPISLRSINTIHFLSAFPEKKHLHSSLYAELEYLNKRYEYHILGNHLLENAFAMLMGGCFFDKLKWRTKAEAVLRKELREQITDDGAHFERSPMYHQIILFRVLEAISYVPHSNSLHLFLSEVAAKMLSWLNKITFRNGHIPHFKDSAPGIARSSSDLAAMAKNLDIFPFDVKLGESGYQKFETSAYECLIDISGIAPVYQPGHSHADHLSFVLNCNNCPIFVDPGTSTYMISQRRQWERSSAAHNTVTFNNHDQSEVWGGFRVGRRARVTVINKSEDAVQAKAEYLTTSGKVLHTRGIITNEKMLIINDSILASTQGQACARFHLHPSVKILETSDKMLRLSGNILLHIEHAEKIITTEYLFAESFNKLAKAIVIEAYFVNLCKTSITMS